MGRRGQDLVPLGQVRPDIEDFGVDHGLLGHAATRETFKDQGRWVHPTPTYGQGPVGTSGGAAVTGRRPLVCVCV